MIHFLVRYEQEKERRITSRYLYCWFASIDYNFKLVCQSAVKYNRYVKLLMVVKMELFYYQCQIPIGPIFFDLIFQLLMKFYHDVKIGDRSEP